jgi:hypothetical protein
MNMNASSCLWPTSDEAWRRKWAATYVAKNVISRHKSTRHKSPQQDSTLEEPQQKSPAGVCRPWRFVPSQLRRNEKLPRHTFSRRRDTKARFNSRLRAQLALRPAPPLPHCLAPIGLHHPPIPIFVPWCLGGSSVLSDDKTPRPPTFSRGGLSRLKARRQEAAIKHSPSRIEH